ncbi:MAG: hypothetical protein AAF846_02015 [Chloroflexota bacterium]
MSLQPLISTDIWSERVQQSLDWTPYDCISSDEHFREAERQQIASSWLQALADEDDYRYLDTETNTLILAERLDWDSDFFGYTIVRLNAIIGDDESTFDQTLEKWLIITKERGVTYIMALALPENLAFLHTLGACGFQLIETRLTYHQQIEAVMASERYPVRHATSDDIQSLSITAREMVNPFDRFHADPYITPYDADRMMSEWVRASIETAFADFVLVPDVKQPRGFVTVKTHQYYWDSWGIHLAQSVVLGAIAPQHKGWYYKLISESNHQLGVQGATHVFWKTQATNRPAMRTAEKLGYRLGRAECVFRLTL